MSRREKGKEEEEEEAGGGGGQKKSQDSSSGTLRDMGQHGHCEDEVESLTEPFILKQYL